MAQTTVLTTTQAAQLIGSSRQHVADLADRGVIRSWRAGSHRRFTREDVISYRTHLEAAQGTDGLNGLSLSDRKGLAFGLLIAARLVTSPDSVLDRARRNLEHLRSVHSDGSADRYLDRWAEILAGPVETLLAVLTSLDERSIELRHAAPFAGVLTEEERHSVIAAVRYTAA